MQLDFASEVRRVSDSDSMSTPALIGKKSRGGAGFRGAAAYALEKAGARVIDTNMLGRNARELSAEIAHNFQLRPRLKRRVDARSISVSKGIAIDDRTFARIARRYRELMGYGDAPFLAVRHTDTDHPHIHLVFSRIRPDGSVVSDSNDYKRSEAALRAIEREFNLHLPEQSEADRASRRRRARKTDASERARLRAERRGTPPPSPVDLLERVKSALSDPAVTGWTRLQAELQARGVETRISTRTDGSVSGWALRATGTSEWLKASAVNRALSARRLGAWLADRERLQSKATDRIPTLQLLLQARRDVQPLQALQAHARLSNIRVPLAPMRQRQHPLLARLQKQPWPNDRRRAAARKLAISMLRRALHTPRPESAIARDERRLLRLEARLRRLELRLQQALLAPVVGADRRRLVSLQGEVNAATVYARNAAMALAREREALLSHQQALDRQMPPPLRMR